MQLSNKFNFKFKDVCIVGFGRHAEYKILPALEKANLKLKYIITSKNLRYKNVKIIENIYRSTKIIKKRILIIITSPPAVHFKQAYFFLKNGYNVIVEKPIVLNFNQMQNLLSVKSKKNQILIENFMYQYTKIYNENKKLFNINKNKILKIDINFLIPELKYKSFRNSKCITSSYIYDIGSYVVSYLNNLGLDYSFKEAKIININKENQENLSFKIITNSNIKIKIFFGYISKYKNNVVFYLKNKIFFFDNIFNGLEIEKKIIMKDQRNNKINIFKDKNGFVNIFNKKKSFWIKNQSKRDEVFLLNSKKISELSKFYLINRSIK